MFLELLAGYVICGFVAIIGFVVVWKVFVSKDISTLLSEKDGSGGTSMARFQLLIFIFVIALSFFLVVISNIKIVQARPGDNIPVLPEVPNGVLALPVSAAAPIQSVKPFRMELAWGPTTQKSDSGEDTSRSQGRCLRKDKRVCRKRKVYTLLSPRLPWHRWPSHCLLLRLRKQPRLLRRTEAQPSF